LWHAKYPPHRALTAPFLGLTVQFCREPCGCAAGFNFLTVEIVQIETKSLLASRTANDFSHPRSTWQRPRSKRGGRCSRQHEGRWQAWEQLQLVRVPGFGYTIAMEGRDINGREDILDGNIEALISAVESRRIRAIERARGGAGWFGFQQALRGILGTLFWRKSLCATKRPELTFWNKISTGSPWNLRRSSLAEKFAHGEKTSDDFLEQIFPGCHWRKAGVRRPLATLEKTG